MTPPLRSSAITAVSTLLRAAPSLGGASLLSASPRACAFRLPSPPKVPAVQRKSLKQDRAASMPDAVWPVSRCRPNWSRRNITRRFRRHLSAFDTWTAVHWCSPSCLPP